MLTTRVFFAFEVDAAWPENYPSGRLIQPKNRHLTAAFLGETPLEPLMDLLPTLPEYNLKLGICGKFDKVLFLPPRHPSVVAWRIEWLEDPKSLLSFQKQLVEWLKHHNYLVKEHPVFLPHITVCRGDFSEQDWKKAFVSAPCIVTHLHLFESLGHSEYRSLWSKQIGLPFEEMEHTADIAYTIKGETVQQLFIHAQMALAFRFPQMLHFFETKELTNLNEVVASLNDIVAKADTVLSCPYKAVSYHGKLKKENEILTWEMIVDV